MNIFRLLTIAAVFDTIEGQKKGEYQNAGDAWGCDGLVCGDYDCDGIFRRGRGARKP
jgi:hypothetical protein